MAEPDRERDDAADASPPLPTHLVSRPLAAFALALFLGGAALSAWLVVSGDFGRARPAPTTAGEAAPPR